MPIATRLDPTSNPQSPPASKRHLANQQNAQKSTGPRTKEGKARSSQNALKHGLRARQGVLTSLSMPTPRH